jgi:tetratricopeptide (TPR) repeat protein
MVPDPRDEESTLVRKGRDAFAAGAYGRAAELFQRVIALAPVSPESYFLLAQAQLALGKYSDAVAAVHKGLYRQPDWPAVGLPLGELYGGDRALLTDHLRELSDAAADRPEDAGLQFLKAYCLWFDGRRAEALDLFRRVRDRVARPEVIDRFLRAAPGA